MLFSNEKPDRKPPLLTKESSAGLDTDCGSNKFRTGLATECPAPEILTYPMLVRQAESWEECRLQPANPVHRR